MHISKIPKTASVIFYIKNGLYVKEVTNSDELQEWSSTLQFKLCGELHMQHLSFALC